MKQQYTFTKHALIRSQQRGIDQRVVNHLFSFGRKIHSFNGSIRYIFTPAARRRLKRQLSSKEYAHIESKLNAFAVVSDAGDVVTVGFQTKRIRH